MKIDKEWTDNLVSVITPVYNSDRFISQTIESVLSQTYSDIEIILVDDCSSDNSAEIISGYTEEHQNVRYFCQDKNMGASAARNKALELANGRYVAFLDSDDVWKSEKIERQIELMKKTGTPISYTAIEMINENGENIKGKRNVPEKADYKKLLKNTLLATSTVIVDRKQLGDFRMPPLRSGQDYATWLQLLRGNVVARGINEALVSYRISSGSLSSNKFKSIGQVWTVQVKLEELNPVYATFNTCGFILNALKKYLI